MSCFLRCSNLVYFKNLLVIVLPIVFSALSIVFCASHLVLVSCKSLLQTLTNMSEMAVQFPLVDVSGYINPTSPEDKAEVVAQIRDAFKTFGFFQCTGHGVPVSLQRAMFKSLERFFSLPKEEKMEISVFKSPCRRGYEAPGAHSRDGKAIPDAKEVNSRRHVDGRVTHS